MLVRALGPLVVEPGGTSPGTGAGSSGVGGPRQRTVLAALVMRAGHTVSPTVLADAVWPDGPPPAATGTMQAYISRLRALLGAERLLRTEGGYRLALERGELDEWLLADALREAEHNAEDSHHHLVDALSLWRGPPLGDLSTELFAAPYVAAMDDLHVRAASRAARHLLDRDDAQEAASVLTRAIAEHPYERPSSPTTWPRRRAWPGPTLPCGRTARWSAD